MRTSYLRATLSAFAGTSLLLANAATASGTSVPLAANFAVPDELLTGYYNIVRDGTPETDLQAKNVQVDATYADILAMLKGSSASSGNQPTTESVLKPFVYETQEIHYLKKDMGVKAGYLTAQASFSNNDLLIVERWSKFVNVVIGSNKTRAKVGFSISLVTKASLQGVSLDAGTLIRNLTLQAKREHVALTSQTEVMGLSGRQITAELPAASTFLAAQATAAALAQSEKRDVMQARNEAFLTTAADFFIRLRKEVWDASYVQPVIIAIDEDDLKRLVN